MAPRVFAKHPGFTAIAIVSIAFGTGANVAMFSLADRCCIRPLPVPRPGELVTVGSRIKRGIVTLNVASYPDYVDIRERATSFSGLLAHFSGTVGFSTEAGTSPHVKFVTMVNGDYFRMLGVAPAIGRGFLPEEDRVAGRDAVVVLSHATWQQEFAADPSVVGRTVQIAGIEFTVVGVAPESFTGLHPYVREAAFVPLAMWPRVMSFPHVDPLDRARLPLPDGEGPPQARRDALEGPGRAGGDRQGARAGVPETNARQADRRPDRARGAGSSGGRWIPG